MGYAGRRSRIVGWVAVLLAYAAVPAIAGDAQSSTEAPIRDVLPAWRQGAESCYQGSFTTETIEVEDWRQTRAVPVPGLIRDGHQVMRPQPGILPGQKVRQVTLQLTYDSHSAGDHDRSFGCGISIVLDGWAEPLLAVGDCPYRDVPRMHDGYDVPATATTLYCGIDCDGGGMAVDLVAGSRDVAVVFDGWPSGMRMSAGCAEGHFRVGATHDSEGTAVPREARKVTRLRLHKAPRSACKPIERWWAVERKHG